MPVTVTYILFNNGLFGSCPRVWQKTSKNEDIPVVKERLYFPCGVNLRVRSVGRDFVEAKKRRGSTHHYYAYCESLVHRSDPEDDSESPLTKHGWTKVTLEDKHLVGQMEKDKTR